MTAAAADLPLEVPGRYSFMRERRWIGLISFMVLVSVVCTFLGFWQWNRHFERQAAAAQLEAAYDAPVAPVPQVLSDPPRVVTPEVEWRRVALTGTYLDDHPVILRSRPVDGTAAGHILVPFLVTSSAGTPVEPTVVIVNRGWIPASDSDAISRAEAPVPTPPQGEVSIDARLRVAESPHRRSPGSGIALGINPGQVMEAAGLAGQSPAPVLDGYAQATAEHGFTPGPRDPQPFPRPSTTLGNNLSYALQWWFFAVGAQLAWLFLARREADEREEEILFGMIPGQPAAGDGGAARASGAGRAGTLAAVPAGMVSSVRRRPRARTEDDDVEDALIDSSVS